MAIHRNTSGTLTQAQLTHPENLRELRQGLLGLPRRISSKFFYDDRGSDLFCQITELEEYYLTACEFEILHQNASRIGKIVAGSRGNTAVSILEAGPGDGRKTQIITRSFANLFDSVSYGAIDISPEALDVALQRVSQDMDIQTHSVIGDTLHSLPDLVSTATGSRLFLFLGSNIGNYASDGAARLLSVIREALFPGDFVLIGFDLEKEQEILIPAYSDSKGVTREFNLNLLKRLNRELGADFDVNEFEHEARYNVEAGAMQSFLVSQKRQKVNIEAMGLDLVFEQAEEIHTENSHKFTLDGIESMASRAGFVPIEHFFDTRNYFTTSLWKIPDAAPV
ncbi:MAG: L-histidine N(alpha)-methyltransferase [Spirochaetia bacterium]|nr:L-histidine N(alpha)-methyltransferase [Spirochaetia bacterium]